MTRTYGREGQDAVALVTGAARGIGQACATALAEEGVVVAVVDVDEAGARAAVAGIEAAGGRATAIACDVTDEASCAAAIQSVVERYGHLDAAVNAAGVVGRTSGLDGSEWDLEVFDRILDVNLRGVMLSLKHELPPMLERGSGSIVNIASGASFIGVPGSVAYTASKAGVMGLTRAAALEHARSGVRINAVCPGAVRTQMLAGFEDLQAGAHPVGRIAEPMEIGTAVRWLCSSDSSFVVGAGISVDGGFTAA